MALNVLPKTIGPLLTLCRDMENGLSTYSGAVGVLQNTEAVMAAARGAAMNAERAFQTGRGAQPALTGAQTLADSNAKVFIGTARGILSNYLGVTWSEEWLGAGFQNGSLAAGANMEERMGHLQHLATYFTAHPAQESPPLVTSARASALKSALADARGAVNQGSTGIAQAKAARDVAVAALRKRMRGLIEELSTLIGDDDPRWHAFGLNCPATAQTPDIPEDLALAQGSPGTLHAGWKVARRADRYRVWQQTVGADAEFIAAATVTDRNATLTALRVGATVNIRVTAVNDAGESLPGEVVSVVVG